MIPSAASCTATTNSIAPSTTDWMWPAPSPWTKSTKNRPHTTAATSATTAAAIRNTRSGSYCV